MIIKMSQRLFLKLSNFCYYRNNKNNGNEKKVSTVFYDRSCPLCRIEMQRLKNRDKHDYLFQINMGNADFSADDWGVNLEDLDKALHVLTSEGEWLVGMPAVRHVYQRVGLAWLVAPTEWPLISALMDKIYQTLAPHRVVVSRWIGLSNAQTVCTDEFCELSAEHNDGREK